MKIYKCDKCEKELNEFEIRNNYLNAFTGTEKDTHKHSMELCSPCRERLEAFLDKTPEQEGDVILEGILKLKSDKEILKAIKKLK